MYYNKITLVPKMKVYTEDPVLNRCQDHTINKNKKYIQRNSHILDINRDLSVNPNVITKVYKLNCCIRNNH